MNVPVRLSLLLALAVVLAAGGSALGAGRERSANGTAVPQIGNNLDAFTLPVPKPWSGDFDAMRERRVIRFLIPYSKTYYFIDHGRELGITHDFAVEFVKWLNRKYKPKVKALRLVATFIPVTRDKLLPALQAGIGDVAAGDITVTPERLKAVDFTPPSMPDVHEIVVTGPGAPRLSSLDDLAGKTVPVRKSSSFYEHLVSLSRSFKDRNLPEISFEFLEEDLEDEDVLEMVNAGIFPITVVDEPVAEVWSRIFKKMTVRKDLVVNHGGDIAWAIRKNSPLLMAEIGDFMKTHREGTQFGNVVVKSYTSEAALRDSLSDTDAMRFVQLDDILKKYAGQYSFDYLMIAAQGFQESHLDQSRRSPRGAVGVMQLMPQTAADPKIGVSGIDKSADQNILAGVKYLRFLTDTYIDDPRIDAKNRTLMAFAAYNAGPGNLQKFRRIAEKSGLDPNVWFNNVEIAAARTVGRETVDYVSNIYKYYVAYKLSEQRIAGRAEKRPAQASGPGSK
jgi:membrane-bound lytic murein transglycosylase MltF